MNGQKAIEQLWKIELELLDIVHEICISHGLCYTLAYGSLIGAIRHGGFIPWDDDIDIIMPREDYEKLLSIWSKEVPEQYILQNIHINSDYTNTFSKIRKDHTTFLQIGEESKLYHKGIFIDIFPADRVAEGKVFNTLQYIACAVNLLYTRRYRSGSGGVVGLVEKILLVVPKVAWPRLRDMAEKIVRRWNDNCELRWFVPSTIEYARHYYPADLFENMGTISFCEKDYFCVANPDAFLRADYGDYMQLPPEEDRVWKHHPICLDFEKNYEERLK